MTCNDGNLFIRVCGKRLNQMISLWRMFMEKSRLFVILVQCILRKACLSSMTVTNELQLLPVPELLFQKIFQLPKSRIAAVKEKLVNIPIHENERCSADTYSIT